MARRDPQIVAALCRWFDREARDLPWRRRRTGYTALVAEAMLQQTQVSRVLQRYAAFVRRFPTAGALAAADEQEVLSLWQGLGYYRRARHLHGAAKLITRLYGGRVPRDVHELVNLPGVGRYTAAAIASIVYGKREPAVDGNTQRVLARLDANDGPPMDRRTIRRAWERAADLVGCAAEPGTLNEALMELGALVCTPQKPRCGRCPLASQCRALAQGCQDRIPPPRPAARKKQVHHHAVVIFRAGAPKVLLEQRPAHGMWSRLWQVPTVEAPRRLNIREVKDALPVPVTGLTLRGSFEHQTTHRWITFHVYTAGSRWRKGRWRRLDDTEDLPMSNAQRKVLAGSMRTSASPPIRRPPRPAAARGS